MLETQGDGWGGHTSQTRGHGTLWSVVRHFSCFFSNHLEMFKIHADLTGSSTMGGGHARAQPRGDIR